MINLVQKIKDAIDKIEMERGKFDIKCLIANDKDSLQWILVLAAEWFEDDELARLNYLSEMITSTFDIDCIVQFSSIRTIDENSRLYPLLKQIQNNYETSKNLVFSNAPLMVDTADEYAKIVVPLNESIKV